MSLKKIAALTGTSISTVSRILNKKDYCGKNRDLYERIWETARELDYFPNTSAQKLRNKFPEKTAVNRIDVFLTRFTDINQDPFFAELLTCLKEEMIQHGFYLNDILTLPDISAKMSKKNIKMTATNSTKGIIILGKCPSELVHFIRNQYSAIVGIDRNPTDFEYAEVTCDGKRAAAIAVDYLYSLGHRKIAYMGDCSYESRYVGYYQTLLSHNIPLNNAYVFPCSQTRSEGRQIMLDIIKSKNRPTAFLCANDITALGVLDAMRLSKKKDYNPSIVSIDNIEEASTNKPSLTTISIPINEMAHQATILIMDQIKNSKITNLRIEFPVSLIIRET